MLLKQRSINAPFKGLEGYFMDRRKLLKVIATGAMAAPAVMAGCNTDDKKNSPVNAEPVFNLDRNPDEVKHEKEVLAREDVFTAAEMTTITILADMIIPKDAVSGSASEAKVPEFIAFIVKDMPQHQIPMKGGLRWLDMQCLNRFEKAFAHCSREQQIQMVDKIAYPKKATAEMSQGVAFFNLMRNLTASGFYTSPIGVKDIGYAGNSPTQWNGVPAEVLQQYNQAYTQKEQDECIRFDEK